MDISEVQMNKKRKHCIWLSTNQDCRFLIIILPDFFFLFCFLGQQVQHMEVPRRGVELELQLPAYTTATAMPDSSCIHNLLHRSQQCWILTHWAKPGIKPASSRILVGFITAEPWQELPVTVFNEYELHFHVSKCLSYLYLISHVLLSPVSSKCSPNCPSRILSKFMPSMWCIYSLNLSLLCVVL